MTETYWIELYLQEADNFRSVRWPFMPTVRCVWMHKTWASSSKRCGEIPITSSGSTFRPRHFASWRSSCFVKDTPVEVGRSTSSARSANEKASNMNGTRMPDEAVTMQALTRRRNSDAYCAAPLSTARCRPTGGGLHFANPRYGATALDG